MIWGALLPALLLDLYVAIYQALCFPSYGIPKARRRDYFVMDRRRLPYLSGLEKLGCTYCSYFNGLVAYVQEVAARTEQYWCPIRHRLPLKATHSRYHRFLPYGDAEAHRKRLEAVRRDFADLLPPDP